MFDAGPPHQILGNLRKVMSPFDRTIDAIVITNPDADHISGFLEVLKNYKVGMVLEPGTLNDSKIFQSLKAEIKRQNIPDYLARRGTRLDIGGGAYIDILFPDRNVRTWSTNDGSIVAKLTYGKVSIMLAGDATQSTEKIIISENNLEKIKSTVLKVGHHGSHTSTGDEFVKVVSPEYAFISDGKNNKYGHPHAETLKTLMKYGVKIFRTDISGNIIFQSDGLNELVSSHK